ncbi:MAG: hypothetical protein ACREBA_01045 [Nitrosotalea sp.]
MSSSTPASPIFRVIRTIKIASTLPSRLGKMDYLVTYSVDGKGSYTINIPEENYNEVNIKTAIKSDYSKHAKLHNLTFS